MADIIQISFNNRTADMYEMFRLVRFNKEYQGLETDLIQIRKFIDALRNFRSEKNKYWFEILRLLNDAGITLTVCDNVRNSLTESEWKEIEAFGWQEMPINAEDPQLFNKWVMYMDDGIIYESLQDKIKAVYEIGLSQKKIYMFFNGLFLVHINDTSENITKIRGTAMNAAGKSNLIIPFNELETLSEAVKSNQIIQMQEENTSSGRYMFQRV